MARAGAAGVARLRLSARVAGRRRTRTATHCWAERRSCSAAAAVGLNALMDCLLGHAYEAAGRTHALYSNEDRAGRQQAAQAPP